MFVALLRARIPYDLETGLIHFSVKPFCGKEIVGAESEPLLVLREGLLNQWMYALEWVGLP